MKIRANGIDIEVEDSGAGAASDGRARPVVLLIMGLGMQLVAWPPAMVQALVDAGYRVIRFDNRDIGLSQHFDHFGPPNLVWSTIKYRLRLAVKSPYSLRDMAADALGVLDALGIKQAHVVGVSMGGMIAQRVALAAPDRVLSLTSIMSSSGARRLPEAQPKVLRVLLGRPASAAAHDVAKHYVKLFQVIGSPGFALPEGELHNNILQAFKRSFHPAGSLRQTLAIVADSTRADQLQRITSPTLVLHGKADPLVPFACGEDTARRIPGARLVGVEGMGHDLPPGVVQRLLASLIPFLAEPGKVS
jgi:pimeloyl-ACP methyl ester carboxylesterase